jgi:hypothetical protein
VSHIADRSRHVDTRDQEITMTPRLQPSAAPRELMQAWLRVQLALLIIAINGWNRIGVGFRAVQPVTEPRAA